MASCKTVVHLGYLDELVTSKNSHHLSYAVSKIGGLPNWCFPNCHAPVCARCKRKEVFVLQIYAPLEGSYHHRTLYIFACLSPECWNRSCSWTCIRSEMLDPKSSKNVSSGAVSTEKAPSPIWFEEGDYWGSEDEDNGNTDNFIHPSTNAVLQYMARKKMAHEPTNSEDNLNQRKPSRAEPQNITDVAHYMEKKLNLNEGDSNANESICGAVGMQGNVSEGMEASALIEGPEDDVISLETPFQVTTDIPALFKEATRIDTSTDVSFASYFITTGIEPKENTGLSEHESELLLRYSQETGHELMEESSLESCDGQGDGMYEKTTALHGDTFMYKFKKRISRSPQQIIRYCREEWASPLWLLPPIKAELPKLCNYCGERLIFEFQIMPQLISCLHLSNMKGAHSSVLEFGTVIIYTCSSSCWKEGEVMRLEQAIVQGEDI